MLLLLVISPYNKHSIMLTKTLSYLFIPIMLFSCSCDDDQSISCERSIEIDETAYETAPDWQVTIIESEIVDDCLHLKFGASGCSDKGWNVRLIDADVILKSLPVQRNIRLSVTGTGLCDAYITKEMTFDLSQTQLQTENTINFNLKNSEEVIEYHY